jgi:ATP phosphoribosyltransferase regulatory subunit
MAAMVSLIWDRILAAFRGATVASVRRRDATKFRLAAGARTRYQAALVPALAIPIAMNDFARRALLPAGFADLLPPEAGLEAATVERLMALFGAQGYVRVKPPLVEFEESLLTGAGAAMARHSFRLMDPVSQRMLALRPDMTLQVARIAAVRLRNEPRPLRLCYAGQVLRVVGDALRSSRQFGQIGCELIGSAAVGADVEAVLLAATALAEIGTPGLSVDLSSPTLAAAIIESAGLPASQGKQLRDALDRKDAASVARLGGAVAATLGTLLRQSGDATRALEALATIELPARAAEDAQRLRDVVGALQARRPELSITVDLIENRGFEYHTGLCFTLFARGVRGELGRGGRYLAGGDFAEGGGEPATGFTLYTDTILRALPAVPRPRRIYVPIDAPPATAEALRGDGWSTLAALERAADPRTEASRLGCSHVWIAGAIHALQE